MNNQLSQPKSFKFPGLPAAPPIPSIHPIHRQKPKSLIHLTTQQEAELETLTLDVLKSTEIEGVFLNPAGTEPVL
jgi:hypothetical protein